VTDGYVFAAGDVAEEGTHAVGSIAIAGCVILEGKYAGGSVLRAGGVQIKTLRTHRCVKTPSLITLQRKDTCSKVVNS